MLEEWSIYGSGLRERIIKDKLEKSKKYVTTEEALGKEEKDPKMFVLGLVASSLERNGIETAIKNDEYVDKKEAERKTIQEIQLDLAEKEREEKEEKLSLQLLSNGMIGKKKYELIFGMNEYRANQIISNAVEKHKFTEIIKEKINKTYNVPKDEMVVTIPSKNHAQLTFHKRRI